MATGIMTRSLTEQEQQALRVAAAVSGKSVDVFMAGAVRAAILRVAASPNGASVRAILDGQKKGKA